MLQWLSNQAVTHKVYRGYAIFSSAGARVSHCWSASHLNANLWYQNTSSLHPESAWDTSGVTERITCSISGNQVSPAEEGLQFGPIDIHIESIAIIYNIMISNNVKYVWTQRLRLELCWARLVAADLPVFSINSCTFLQYNNFTFYSIRFFRW